MTALTKPLRFSSVASGCPNLNAALYADARHFIPPVTFAVGLDPKSNAVSHECRSSFMGNGACELTVWSVTLPHPAPFRIATPAPTDWILDVSSATLK